MFAIFEEFLHGEQKPCLANPTKEYLKEFVQNCEQKLSQPNSVDIRWHVAVFFSEFVINKDITANSFDNILAFQGSNCVGHSKNKKVNTIQNL